jgi:transglutaminase-like putative cysteine protease
MGENRGQTPGRFVHLKTNEPVALTLNHVVLRREVTTPPEVLACPATELSDKEKKDLAPWLVPERENPLDDKTREIARWAAPEEKTFTRIARGIYDYVLAHMRYEKPDGKGWGRGSVAWACTEGYGNCTDFHALFMNLCRARGIPARYEMGVSIPAEPKGRIEGYHCWCEFYVPGHGWVPVDASEASRHPEKRDYFFGNLDADRVLLVEGRDLVLDPRQSGGPISLMTAGYAEIGGKPVPIKRELTYVELDRP